MVEWLVYILQCNDKSYYVGITNNLQKRLKKHKEGKGSQFLKRKGKLPFTLVLTEFYDTPQSARHRERYLKKLNKEKKWKAITKAAVTVPYEIAKERGFK